MSRLDDYAIEPAKLARGVVWDFHTKAPAKDNAPHASHICFRIMPHTAAFDSALSEALEPHLPDQRRGRLDPQVYARVRGEVHARVTLVEWWNLEMGTPAEAVPYSHGKALELLTDPRWELVRRFVESAFANEHALLSELEEEARGN